MSINALLLIILLIILIGSVHYSPTIGPWPGYSSGLVLLVVLLLVIFGRI